MLDSHNLLLTTSESGIFMALPVKKEVKIPFFVMGAEGSAPLSISLSLDFGGAARNGTHFNEC